MFKKASVLVALVLALVFAIPASAITWGTPDGEAHPYVGLLVFRNTDTGEAWRCSGTLLSPTVVLTAGHCTYGATQGWAWFDSNVAAGRPANGYPFNVDLTTGQPGTGNAFTAIYTHPSYNDAAFYLHDAGIVILSQPVYTNTYGELPPSGLLDQLSTKRGQQEQTFTPVGYGVQETVPNPNETVALLIRYQATIKLIGVKGTYGIPDGSAVAFTNNPGQPHSGGTCSGDSGGPIFWNGDPGANMIAAVTSFGINTNCVNGGGYRIDQPDDLTWIQGILAAN